jgi:hypothetical protein
MTDQHQAIAALIENIEAGNDDAVRAALSKMASRSRDLGEYWPAHDAMKAYRGSLDAALSLHEALLPNWAVERITMWPGGECMACLCGTHEENGERWHQHRDGRFDARGPTLSRAWLLAILRAYASQLTATSNRKGAAE